MYFVGRLDEALRRAEREGSHVGVVFLDVDRFKVVNDSLGHAAGDELLKAVADRLRESLRPDDVVARFGGDEFTVLVERVADEPAAMEMADRVLSILNRPVNLSHGETYVTRASASRSHSRERRVRNCSVTPTPRCTSPSSVGGAELSCSPR